MIWTFDTLPCILSTEYKPINQVLMICIGMKWKGGIDDVVERTGVKEREVLTYCTLLGKSQRCTAG